MIDSNLIRRVKLFTEKQVVTTCDHKHQLIGTGAVFYQSVGLLECSLCRGWQFIRKPVK